MIPNSIRLQMNSLDVPIHVAALGEGLVADWAVGRPFARWECHPTMDGAVVVVGGAVGREHLAAHQTLGLAIG